MLKRKSLLAGIGVGAALALSVPLALIAAAPAGAVTTCQSSISPNSIDAQSGLKVGCLVDVSATASSNANKIEIHDATNASWHRGAARTVTVTTFASTTITFASGTLIQSDVRRPISGTGVAGGAFITTVLPAACTTACTSATVSKAGTAAAAHSVKIEHTSARYLQDATNTTGAASNLSSATAKFVSTDVNKSVSGGSFSNGARISAVVSGTTVTVTPAPTLAHATADETLTIGGVRYTAASPSTATTYPETWHRQMLKTGGSASCAGSTLTVTAAGGGFTSHDVRLKVTFLNGAATVAGSWRINTQTATTATLSAACPGAAAWTNVVIGEKGANSSADGAAMTSLTASLNLNPALVADQDDCIKNTYEGFQVIGAWQNPGVFAVTGVLGAAPDRSIAQVVFPTAVISFAGYVVPKTTADTQAAPHYDFVFPLLPTSLAICPLGAGTTTNKVAATFGFYATTLTTAPFVPTGSGNPTSPPIRQHGPATGTFGQKVSLYNGATLLSTISPAGCAVISNTATPSFSCGLG